MRYEAPTRTEDAVALLAGEAGEARNHLEIAYTLFEARPELPPEMRRLLDALAEAMFRQDEPRQLIAFTEQAIDRFGNLSDYLRKAEYLARLGDHDSALTAYRAAIEIAEAGDPRAYLALADFYESIGDRDKAVTALTNAYRADPEHQPTRDRLRASPAARSARTAKLTTRTQTCLRVSRRYQAYREIMAPWTTCYAR